MKNAKFSKLWDSLHSSYWFLPSIMAVLATILAFTMLMLDRSGKSIDYWWIYTGGASGARSLLEVVAGSMISVSATAFSITIVALQLAASNFGPRLLRNFMQDTGNQVVLGTFIGTFIYCLLVLRTIHGEGDGYERFVPQLSVTVGILLAIISVGVLIYFIHHASTIIQASHVIENVSDDLHRAIEKLFPEKIGSGGLNTEGIDEEMPLDFEQESRPIIAKSTGYLQAIDDEGLMKISQKYRLLLRIEYQPGKYIINGCSLVSVFPSERVNKKIAKKIHDAFILGNERTEQQDVEFPINQLVEIALRAISPAVNDPFTAIRCIDRLAAGLCHLVQRNFPSPYRYDKNNKLRIIAKPILFNELADSTFNQIRQYGKSDAAVSIRLLEAIARISTYTDNPEYQKVLRHHADMILQDSSNGLSQEHDCKDVQKRYRAVIKSLDKGSMIKNQYT
jgi:uncharacterized membrane protein